MKYSLKIGKEILNFNLAESGEIFNIEFNEKKYNAELIKIDSNLYSMILDGQTCTVAIKKEGKSIEIFYKGDLFSFEIPSDYRCKNVSDKMVRIIVSYIDYVNKNIWKKN